MDNASRLHQLDAKHPLLQLAHTCKPTIPLGCLQHHVLSNFGMGKNEEGFVADYLHANFGNFGWFQHGSRNSNHVSRWPVVRNIGALQHVGVDTLRAQATDFVAACAIGKRQPFGECNG